MKIETVVDRFGQLHVVMADLKAKEEAPRKQLLDSEVDEVEGRLYKAVVSRQCYDQIHYKELVERLQPSQQMM